MKTAVYLQSKKYSTKHPKKYCGMKYLSIFIVSIIAILPGSLTAKPDATASETTKPKADFNELKTLLAPVESLTADFQQELLSESGNSLMQAKGQMWLKKPGQFRWEVQGKDSRLVVSNGKQVWDYDKDLEQVTVQKLAKGEAKAPIFFLTGDVNTLEKDFKIKNLTSAGKSCMKESDQCFELKPKTEQSPFQSISIGFKNKVLNELEMSDQLGQKSFFKFSNAKLNAAVAPSVFQFVTPKGVDVVGN